MERLDRVAHHGADLGLPGIVHPTAEERVLGVPVGEGRLAPLFRLFLHALQLQGGPARAASGVPGLGRVAGSG